MFQLKTILSDAFGEHDGAIHYVEHHLGHAASAYYASPFESAAILTLDGTGESTTTMASYGEGNRIRVLNRVKLPPLARTILLGRDQLYRASICFKGTSTK